MPANEALHHTMNLRLCYQEGTWAWFTDATDKELKWDDADDGYRQGAPYSAAEYQLQKVAFNGPFQSANMKMPPLKINAGSMKYLVVDSFAEANVSIPANVSLQRFIELIQEGGGEVYLPASVYNE